MKKISLILALALTLTAGLAACGSSKHALTPAERQTAELGARQYAGSNADVVGTPSGLDSDNDGYVSATIQPRNGGQATEIVCSYLDGATGCKLKK